MDCKFKKKKSKISSKIVYICKRCKYIEKGPFPEDHGKFCIVRTCTGNPGLGDYIGIFLERIGITKKTIRKLVGKNCGCTERKEKVNMIGHKLISILTLSKIRNAKKNEIKTNSKLSRFNGKVAIARGTEKIVPKSYSNLH